MTEREGLTVSRALHFAIVIFAVLVVLSLAHRLGWIPSLAAALISTALVAVMAFLAVASLLGRRGSRQRARERQRRREQELWSIIHEHRKAAEKDQNPPRDPR